VFDPIWILSPYYVLCSVCKRWLLTACLVNPSPTWTAATKTSKYATIWWLKPNTSITSWTRQGAVQVEDDTQATHKPPLSWGKWVGQAVWFWSKFSDVAEGHAVSTFSTEDWRSISFDTSENFYQTTRRHASEDGIRRGHRCENLFTCLSRRPICSCVGGHDMLQLEVGQLQFEARGLHRTNENGTWH